MSLQDDSQDNDDLEGLIELFEQDKTYVISKTNKLSKKILKKFMK